MAEQILVKARLERGRWRAGMHFTRQGRTVHVDDLDKAQLEAINSDPELIVTELPASDDPNELALARERKATKSGNGKRKWAEAEARARTAAGLAEEAWATQPAADRVGLIEAALEAGA
ncbi:hypothetical protein N5D45_13825 [Stenotrophomonas sp. GD03819]|uniref:hypothetical protein n=1 Tax=Stenotrophomonas sp. GD03819 TaxID=2975384 RepID=UPI00244B029A|nr:hypothetical protein [Stenotrophomonas sp. GD03819]MDH1792893.1 hypothetical protein [Stenotrophomonas sp. GD03819]